MERLREKKGGSDFETKADKSCWVVRHLLGQRSEHINWPSSVWKVKRERGGWFMGTGVILQQRKKGSSQSDESDESRSINGLCHHFTDHSLIVFQNCYFSPFFVKLKQMPVIRFLTDRQAA